MWWLNRISWNMLKSKWLRRLLFLMFQHKIVISAVVHRHNIAKTICSNLCGVWNCSHAHQARHFKHSQPSGRPVLSMWKLHDIKAEMFFLPLVESADRDRWATWHQRPPGYIHPNGSGASFSPLSLLSDQVSPIETLSWKVRGHTNNPTPSSFHWTFLLHFCPSHGRSYFLLLPYALSLSLSRSLFLWHFGLLIWLEEESLVDPCCHSYQTHTWIAAGNHPKYTLVETKALRSPGDTSAVSLQRSTVYHEGFSRQCDWSTFSWLAGWQCLTSIRKKWDSTEADRDMWS